MCTLFAWVCGHKRNREGKNQGWSEARNQTSAEISKLWAEASGKEMFFDRAQALTFFLSLQHEGHCVAQSRSFARWRQRCHPFQLIVLGPGITKFCELSLCLLLSLHWSCAGLASDVYCGKPDLENIRYCVSHSWWSLDMNPSRLSMAFELLTGILASWFFPPHLWWWMERFGWDLILSTKNSKSLVHFGK